MSTIYRWKRRRRLSAAELAISAGAAAAVAMILQPQWSHLALLGAPTSDAPQWTWPEATIADAGPPGQGHRDSSGPLVGAIGASEPGGVIVHQPAASVTEPSYRAGQPGVRVVDGDSLEIGGERIRLHGVDAFEHGQTCQGRACGDTSRQALQALTRGQRVTCTPTGADRYGRTVARCSAGGRDLGAEMVRSGQALAYEQYSRDYVDEERAARAAGAGAWAHGDFIDPADYRRRR